MPRPIRAVVLALAARAAGQQDDGPTAAARPARHLAGQELKAPREGGLVGLAAIAALVAWFAMLWLIFGDML
jgi:hypothetical protein